MLLAVLFTGAHAIATRVGGTTADRAAALIAFVNALALTHTLLTR
ncbi:hypothetical protein [Streptomyces sp. NPDC053048]